jgi:hypothetical protein
MTNLVLTVPLLAVARRWRPPIGTATCVYASVSALSAAVSGLRHLPLFGGMLLAGVVIDVIGRAMRPGPDRPVRWYGYAALAPLVTWVTFLVVAYAIAGPQRPQSDTPHPERALELITGAPLLQALAGVLVAAVLVMGRDRGTEP